MKICKLRQMQKLLRETVPAPSPPLIARIERPSTRYKNCLTLGLLRSLAPKGVGMPKSLSWSLQDDRLAGDSQLARPPSRSWVHDRHPHYPQH
jgi:hypothetical protein